MRLECKCHGVSGSCTVRTCWQTMAPFGATARWLKNRYDHATEVTVQPDGTGLQPGPGNRSSKTRKKDLVYLEASPDYCDADASYGRERERERFTIYFKYQEFYQLYCKMFT